VLIGDAAGHNDPGIGCGLSVAMRDARRVRDLVLAGARSADDFVPYGAERFERIRRLRLIGDLKLLRRSKGAKAAPRAANTLATR
jgi:menaquinone-9 beta-reductase